MNFDRLGGVARAVAAGVGIALLALSGCATAPATPEQAVEARARAWVEARNKGDWQRVYELLAPSYRALNAFDAWQARMKTRTMVQSVEYASAKCPSPDRCTVGINQQYVPPPRVRGLMTQYVEQTWLLVDGRWYLLPTD